MTLEQALTAALERSRTEDARVGLAYGQLDYLESQRKFKIELRPNLGWLAFSNPALLASNIGSSFLIHRFRRPDSLAMQGARFDVLAAEIGQERRRLDTQVETAQAYFALLDRQQDEERARTLWEHRREDRERISQMLNVSRVTMDDYARFEAGLADIEAEVIEAEAQRNTAAIELARLTGYKGRVQDLRAADVDSAGGTQEVSLSADAMVEMAIARRRELTVLRNKLEELPAGPSVDRRVQVESAGAGYSYIGQDLATAGGTSAEGFTLGGHTGRGDFGLSINLRDTGEKEASAAINAARRRVLTLEIESAEDVIRDEVETAWYLAEASRRKLKIAGTRRDLLKQMLDSVEVRARHGLASPAAVLAAELDVLRQESAYSQALEDCRAREFHLMTVSGSEGETQPPAAGGRLGE